MEHRSAHRRSSYPRSSACTAARPRPRWNLDRKGDHRSGSQLRFSKGRNWRPDSKSSIEWTFHPPGAWSPTPPEAPIPTGPSYTENNRVARSDDDGPGRNFKVEGSTYTGPHYVVVRGYSNVVSGAYDLNVEFRPSTSDQSFNIELRYVARFSDAEKAEFQRAVSRWESIIQADAEDIHHFAANPRTFSIDWFGVDITLDSAVDDLVVFVNREDGSGAAASSDQGIFRDDESGLPFLGLLLMRESTLDQEDLADGTTYEVFLHELAHTMGFGTMWERRNLLVNPSSLDAGRDTHFLGFNAVRAFDRSGGEDYIGGKVPVENSLEANPFSSRDSHWRQSVFGHEVMVPWYIPGVPFALSNITLQSLFDLGYLVDESLADAYVISETPASVVASGGHPRVRMHRSRAHFDTGWTLISGGLSRWREERIVQSSSDHRSRL